MMFLVADKDNNFPFLSGTRFAEANRCNLEYIEKVFLFQNQLVYLENMKFLGTISQSQTSPLVSWQQQICFCFFQLVSSNLLKVSPIWSWETVPKAVKVFQKLTKCAKSWESMRKSALVIKVWQRISKDLKMCHKLRKLNKVCQNMRKCAKSWES